ncbi:hypothetical protein JCM8097_004558 [Rhodosporidiobolus ruineniae]
MKVRIATLAPQKERKAHRQRRKAPPTSTTSSPVSASPATRDDSPPSDDAPTRSSNGATSTATTSDTTHPAPPSSPVYPAPLTTPSSASSASALADRFPGLFFSHGRPSTLFSFDWKGDIEGAYKLLGLCEKTKDKRMLEILDKIAEEELAPPTVDAHVCIRPRRSPSTRLGAVLILACSRLQLAIAAANATVDTIQPWLVLLCGLYTHEMTAVFEQQQLPLPRPPNDIHPVGHKHLQTLELGCASLDWITLDSRDGVAVPGTYLAATPLNMTPEDFIDLLAAADASSLTEAILPALERAGTLPSPEMLRDDPEMVVRLVKEGMKAGLGAIKSVAGSAATRSREVAGAAVARSSAPPLPAPAQLQQRETASATTERVRKLTSALQGAIRDAAVCRDELERRTKQVEALEQEKEALAASLAARCSKSTSTSATMSSSSPEDLVKLAQYHACEAENVKLRLEVNALRSQFAATGNDSQSATASSPSTTSTTSTSLDRSTFVVARLTKRLEEVSARLKEKTEENLALMLQLATAAATSSAPTDADDDPDLHPSPSSSLH